MSLASPITRAKRASAHYTLRLHLAGAPFGGPVPGADGYQSGELTLPLAPQQVKMDARPRTHLAPHGNEQIADEHGVTPPTITIAGTMGQAAFGSDTLRDGRAWQRDLETVVRYYLEENYRRGTNREPLMGMSWHDTYRGEHWFVTPDGVPYGEQDASNPYRERYTLKLTGLRAYGSAPAASDPLAERIEPARHGALVTNRTPAVGDEGELTGAKSTRLRSEIAAGPAPGRFDRINAIVNAGSVQALQEIL